MLFDLFQIDKPIIENKKESIVCMFMVLDLNPPRYKGQGIIVSPIMNEFYPYHREYTPEDRYLLLDDLMLYNYEKNKEHKLIENHVYFMKYDYTLGGGGKSFDGEHTEWDSPEPSMHNVFIKDFGIFDDLSSMKLKFVQKAWMGDKFNWKQKRFWNNLRQLKSE